MTKKIIMMVDDLRGFQPKYLTGNTEIYRTSAHAIEALEYNLTRKEDIEIDELWLDHDLGGEDTIRPVVNWIIDNRPKIRIIYVHTSNPVGRDWIKRALGSRYRLGIVDAGKFLYNEIEV